MKKYKARITTDKATFCVDFFAKSESDVLNHFQIGKKLHTGIKNSDAFVETIISCELV